jgi:polysaccharide export outer membrane protein
MKKNLKNIVWMGLMILLAGGVGCVGQRSGSNSALDADLLTESNPSHRLVPGDILFIEVKGEKDCSGKFIVDKNGDIKFCYVEKISAKGKTTEEFRQILIGVLEKDYLQNPEVSLEYDQFGLSNEKIGWEQDSVRIIGEVESPGIYQLKRGYRAFDAILEAGGFTEYASPNKTKIVRGKGENKKIIILKMKEIMKTGDQEKDEVLRPGDTILVPEGII